MTSRERLATWLRWTQPFDGPNCLESLKTKDDLEKKNGEKKGNQNLQVSRTRWARKRTRRPVQLVAQALAVSPTRLPQLSQELPPGGGLLVQAGASRAGRPEGLHQPVRKEKNWWPREKRGKQRRKEKKKKKKKKKKGKKKVKKTGWRRCNRFFGVGILFFSGCLKGRSVASH